MQLSDVDLTDPDLFQRGVPYDQFALLRREAPVFWHEESDGPGFWAITRYQDLKRISKQPQLFSSERMGTLRQESSEEDLAIIRNIILNMDPPKHRQYRALVNKAFTPRMVNSLRPRIQQMVKRIINGVIEKGECDFVEDVAAKLPLEVICEMMGVPEEDRRRVYEIGNSLVGFDDPDLQETGQPRDHSGAQDAFAEMFLYGTKLREKAISHPADDLATGLVNAEIDGHKLADLDFNFFFLVLLVAGNETTRTVTSNGMIALLEHPDQHADVQADLSLLNSTVEEILRFAPAVHTFRRQATADVEIRDQQIRENQKLMLWYTSANRDEEVFDAPDTFHIRREPNDHLAFGVGEHFCLGANLARLELREIFRGILTRFHGMEITAKPRRLRSTFINGVKEMQVAFEPGPSLD
ncbi:MAG: cytochrome P450 [Proteobacteria bacterium]|nr:cytochrome P450 [Pseudomonadota bacterium]MCZ6785256.1 cytochrome P450 [Pseudomonadota bacterium]